LRLIITEKNDAAKKISGILGGTGVKAESYLKVPYYLFTDSEGLESAAVGLKGHVVQVDFPPEYAEWRKVEPRDLIDAPLVKTETAKSVVRAVKKLAVDATSLIIATDFDREGELIGLEALNLALEENGKLVRTVRRARFSALTAGEINRAFSNLDHLSEPLARAGEARQDIDLIWGATLTRFVSLATGRLGSQFLSVGRVQTPTLVLVAEREKERRAFVSEPFWVIKVELEHTGQRFSALHKEERFTDEARAQAIFDKLGTPGHGHCSQADLAQGPEARTVQYHQLHHGRHLSRLRRRRSHARRRGPVHGRPYQLPQDRQHGLSAVAGHEGSPGRPGARRVRARGGSTPQPRHLARQPG
jgi:DNA topoisomerase-1